MPTSNNQTKTYDFQSLSVEELFKDAILSSDVENHEVSQQSNK